MFAALAAAPWIVFPWPAIAHSTERGFVLLLPTGHYLIGGATAVAITFLLLCWVPAGVVERLVRARLPLGSVPEISPVPTSLAAMSCSIHRAGTSHSSTKDAATAEAPPER